MLKTDRIGNENVSWGTYRRICRWNRDNHRRWSQRESITQLPTNRPIKIAGLLRRRRIFRGKTWRPRENLQLEGSSNQERESRLCVFPDPKGGPSGVRPMQWWYQPCIQQPKPRKETSGCDDAADSARAPTIHKRGLVVFTARATGRGRSGALELERDILHVVVVHVTETRRLLVGCGLVEAARVSGTWAGGTARRPSLCSGGVFAWGRGVSLRVPSERNRSDP
jgi:hypothetical protein